MEGKSQVCFSLEKYRTSEKVQQKMKIYLPLCSINKKIGNMLEKKRAICFCREHKIIYRILTFLH
jgi:hypothetical protein